jgi:hypothetical protein
LIIDKTAKKVAIVNYGLSNATFETLNHVFTQPRLVTNWKNVFQLRM